MQGSWGLAVGDVCGKGVAAAKSTALARYTLRAEAHRETRPSRILAALNRALLDWLTDDPRFLTAIYATVRPTPAGASVRISSAGHPLALVRRADGRVQSFGRPGTLLGLLPELELHDSRGLLRAGDSMILFTDGVIEARHHASRRLYGDNRLRDLIAGLHGMPAAGTADAIQQAVLEFGGGKPSDDTVTLVLTVPPVRKEQPARAQRAPGIQRGHQAGLLAPPSSTMTHPTCVFGRSARFAVRQRGVHAGGEPADQGGGAAGDPVMACAGWRPWLSWGAGHGGAAFPSVPWLCG